MISRHNDRRSQWNSEFIFRTTSARRPSTDKLVLGSPCTAFPRTIALISFARVTEMGILIKQTVQLDDSS